jgi:hypothetical protein
LLLLFWVELDEFRLFVVDDVEKSELLVKYENVLEESGLSIVVVGVEKFEAMSAALVTT